jgi:hypothetical protein
MLKANRRKPYRRLAAALSSLALAGVAGSAAAQTGQFSGLRDAAPAPGAAGEVQTAPHLDIWTFELEEQPAGTPAGPSGPPRDAAAPAAPPPGTTAGSSPSVEEQTFSYDSLINGNGERRAEVVSWGSGTQTLLKGFQVVPARKDHPVGQSDRDQRDDRLQGMLVEQQWALRDRAELQLTGGWLAGEATTGKPAGDAAGRSGSAWSLGGRAALLERRLRLSFEYAGSRPQAPGTGARPDRAGVAYRADAELVSPPQAGTAWRLGAQFRWVGPRFSSIANPTLTRDRLRLSTFAGIQRDDWRIDLRVDRDRSNLRGDPTVPTRQGERAEIATSWVLGVPGIEQLLGRPRITLAADTEYSQVFPASAPTASPELRQGRRIRLESAFDAGAWRWGLKATGATSAAPGAEGDGTRTARLRLYGDPAAGAALPLKPALTWQRRHDAATDAVDRDWGAELHSGAIALRTGVRANLAVGYLQRRHADDGDRQDALELGGSLVWTLQRPAAGRSGLALAVTGSARGGDATLSGGDAPGDYRLMLSLSSSNPLAGW